MKLPNGFGSITKLSGARRRPYAVHKTINGHQKYLAFFSSACDALAYCLHKQYRWGPKPQRYAALQIYIQMAAYRLGGSLPPIYNLIRGHVIMRLPATRGANADSVRMRSIDGNRLRRAVAVRTAVSVAAPVRTPDDAAQGVGR